MKRKLVIAMFATMLIGVSFTVGCANTTANVAVEQSAQAVVSEDNIIMLSDKEIICNNSGVTVTDSTVTVSKSGTYSVSGNLSDGMLIIDADKEDTIELVLKGVSITNSDNAAIYVKKAGKVIITLEANTDNVLVNSGDYSEDSDGKIDGVIYSKSDLTIAGNGKLIVNAATGNGIVSKDNIVIDSGNLDITAEKHGIEGKDSVTINDGNIVIDAQKDGINSGNEEDNLGNVTINGGDISVTAGDDGIHAEGTLTVMSGNINVSDSYEGIEGAYIYIKGGNMDITAADDGINASGGEASDINETVSGGKASDNNGVTSGGSGSDINGVAGMAGNRGFGGFMDSDGSVLEISGGYVHVNAQGDGLDSNGTLLISGGEVYVDGPSDSGNGALDSGRECTVTGGKVIAIGTSSMAETFGAASTQGSIKVVTEKHEAGTVISLKDSEGKTIIEYTSLKSFDSVVISDASLKVGSKYTLNVGEEVKEIEYDTLSYSDGNGYGGFGGFGNHQRPDGDMQRPDGNMQRPDGMEWQNKDMQMPEGMERPDWDMQRPKGMERPNSDM